MRRVSLSLSLVLKFGRGFDDRAGEEAAGKLSFRWLKLIDIVKGGNFAAC